MEWSQFASASTVLLLCSALLWPKLRPELRLTARLHGNNSNIQVLPLKIASLLMFSLFCCTTRTAVAHLYPSISIHSTPRTHPKQLQRTAQEEHRHSRRAHSVHTCVCMATRFLRMPSGALLINILEPIVESIECVSLHPHIHWLIWCHICTNNETQQNCFRFRSSNALFYWLSQCFQCLRCLQLFVCFNPI